MKQIRYITTFIVIVANFLGCQNIEQKLIPLAPPHDTNLTRNVGADNSKNIKIERMKGEEVIQIGPDRK